MKKISLCAVLIIMANFAYANDLTKTENYYPDGKYGIGSRFARKNPTIEKVKNNVRLTVHSYDNGPIHMDIHKYGGGIYFERRFEDHPLSEHGGWSRPPVTQQVNDFHGSIENGKLGVTNAKIYGVEIHPNDAYDAKDGGDHPYDIYTFTVDGESRYTSIREVEKPKPLPTPPNSPNQPNKNGDNGDKGNQSEPNDSRNDKIRQDSADNSPDLASNDSGEVPLPQDTKSPYDVFARHSWNWSDFLTGVKNEFAAGARDAQSTGLQYEFPADVAKDISGGFDHYTDPDPYAPTNPSQQIGANAALVGSLALGGKNPMSAANKAVNKATNVNHIWSKGAKPSSVDNAYGHWIKHGSDFPQYQNAKQYAQGANDFVKNPPTGTLTKTKNGDTMYYHPQSNTYVVTNSNGEVKTMFKPTRGKAYFDGK